MALSEVRLQVQPPAPAGEVPRIEALRPGDASGGLRLSDAAGWNQVEDDWALFIEHGHSLGARDGEGRLVATAAALPYGADAGWISMVLVDEAWRHRGLASALVRECIADLQTRGALPLLDATEDGAAVYRGLGFAAGLAFDRWQSDGSSSAPGGAPGGASASGVVRRASRGDLDRIASLDRAASELDRQFLFARLLARADTHAWLVADDNGFIVARRGRRATQVGPLVAAHARQAVALLEAALEDTSGPAYVDVPAAQQEIAGWLERRGFRRQRSFVRMSLGAAYPPEVGDRCFTLAGPEFG
ncbi:MAG: GNAT family N-acetyltransferase [Pseudomonadota bacterium]|nr:GNAT family N-acetyltransferase [Pseudomonadota bacterium]